MEPCTTVPAEPRLTRPLDRAAEAVARACRLPTGATVDDRFELIALLGDGGMGAVWRARDRLLGVDVALKLFDTGGMIPNALERGLREARIAAHLQHPAIIRVLGFGAAFDDLGYIAFELLEGESLEDRCADGAMDAGEAVAMLLPIVEAVATAHAAGIIHRDIKPANIFVSVNSAGRLQPKLLDFGVALRRRRSRSRRLTLEGELVGTPEYMAPEQVLASSDVDERADVWGLSVVLFEMIAGAAAFGRASYNAVIGAILTESPELEALGIDAELEAIVARGLAKDRAARWPSARALGTALAGWLLRRGVQTDITGSSLARIWSAYAPPLAPAREARAPLRRALAAGALVAAALAALAPSVLGESRAPEIASRLAPALPRLELPEPPPIVVEAPRAPTATRPKAAPPPKTAQKSRALPRRGERSHEQRRPAKRRPVRANAASAALQSRVGRSLKRQPPERPDAMPLPDEPGF